MGKCEKILDIAKRRGFFWSSYELYGGVAGFTDYGPLGALMKRKIEQKWIETFVTKEQLLLIETPIIAPQAVFDASGHTTHFTDPIVNCKKCGKKWRGDHLLEDKAGIASEGLTISELGVQLKKFSVQCPNCNGELEAPQLFNELFATHIGPYREAIGFCRPETAQGMFVNFKRLLELAKNKLPLGVAQVGRCLRNEISPRQGPIRLRELTIMEFEFFFDPENAVCDRLTTIATQRLRILPEALLRQNVKEPVEVSVQDAVEKGMIKAAWVAYFMACACRFLENLGIPLEKQFFKEKLINERAHYSAQTFDQLVELDRWGWVEIAGYAWRTDYDLKMHMAHSGEDMRVFIPYPKPSKVKTIRLLPNEKELKEVFGDSSEMIIRLLTIMPPDVILKELKERGFYLLRGNSVEYSILPSHVGYEEVEVEETGRRVIPHVVEPSFGSDRILYATLENAYTEKGDRAVLRLPVDIAPVSVAVFPLVSRDGLPEKAAALQGMLIREGFTTEYDDGGSIGRRYARADEIGVPVALTVDYQTLEDDSVTARDRDTWSQVRILIREVPDKLSRFLRGQITFQALGEPVKKGVTPT